ncbi:6386_t:CDS:1, partial [Dentiscutata heterogama]
YICVNWNSIVKYLNDTPETVKIKGKLFVPFLAKYIFMISHKPAKEAFNFGQRNMDDEASSQHDWKQFN